MLEQLLALPQQTLLLAIAAMSALALLLAAIAAFRPRHHRGLTDALAGLALADERLERGLTDALQRARSDNAEAARHLREEVRGLAEHWSRQQGIQAQAQREQHAAFEQRLASLTELQRNSGETLRTAVDSQLRALRDDNTAKLEAMRMTVDEKLQGTLEQRLGESFKLVSDRLEAVHKGLGEMQTLASGVGDLKRVLTNVKSRGTWGEVQLGSLLEQVLTPSQYVTNAVMADHGAERVEFAIVLPGQGETERVFLPIDAKFPVEDYERLQAAADQGDAEAVEAAARALDARLKASARDISSKYVHPPRTTDFAILFLPTEGLYAEAIRRPGLADELQRTCRVVIAGPTTLTAILNSLQMGFRTLAIQQRSSEVWQVLGAVKTEFNRFGPVLEKVKKKLQEASNQIETAQTRGRAIERRLRQVEQLPMLETAALLGTVDADLFADAPDAAVDHDFLHEASDA